MAIPKFDELMIPFLVSLTDTREHSLSEMRELLAGKFSISESELAMRYEKSKARIFDNRVAWARDYLRRATFLEPTGRAMFRITGAGLLFLDRHARAIAKNDTLRFYDLYDEKVQSTKGSPGKSKKTKGIPVDRSGETPIDVISRSVEELNSQLAFNLVDQVRSQTPEFLENLVVDLLVAMGYGGSHKNAGRVTGGSHDGGVDGEINEDKLGLDVIYFQAKNWKSPVSEPEIARFAGALDKLKAQKGVFVTTSEFTKHAKDFVDKAGKRIILIDGIRLGHLMIEYDVGVRVLHLYSIKSIDDDYFSK